LQYECINCGLCVDACNEVMDKMGYPRGLIRYATETEVESGKARHWFQPRTIGYGFAMGLMIAAAAWMLTSRAPVELEVTRDRGGLYQTGRGGTIENSYTLKITNRETDAQTYQVTPLGPDGIELLEPIETRVDGLGSRTLPAVVLIPGTAWVTSRHRLSSGLKPPAAMPAPPQKPPLLGRDASFPAGGKQ